MVLLALLLACGGPTPELEPEPAALPDIGPAPEPFEKPDRRGKKDDPADYGTDENIIPLLGFASDALPKTVEGLRPAGPPGEYDIDAKSFEWSGPKPRDGRLRYQQRRLRRASINVVGRKACDELLEAITGPHGEPQQTQCSERLWETDKAGIRYFERPQQASCSVVVMVDSFFPPLESVPENAIDKDGLLGIPLGKPLTEFGDLRASEDRRQVHARTTGNPSFKGVETYGPTWTFYDGALEEFTVRANMQACDNLRTHLVDLFGVGEGGHTDGDLNWVGCKNAVEYRYNASMFACRVTVRGLDSYFERVEWENGQKNRAIDEKRAELEAYLDIDGENVSISADILKWFEADPERQNPVHTRKPMTRSRDGEDAGFKLSGVKPGGFMHSLGFRERDWIVGINGVPAHAYEPTDGDDELEVTVRRGGEDQVLLLTFADGVLPRIREMWGQFP